MVLYAGTLCAFCVGRITLKLSMHIYFSIYGLVRKLLEFIVIEDGIYSTCTFAFILATY